MSQLDPEPEPGWRAAGVLPYSILNGTVLCLMGKEYSLAPSTTRLLVGGGGGGGGGDGAAASAGVAAASPVAEEPQYRSWWSDFGGGREAEDASAVHTACREWAEETVGVYGDGTTLQARVESSAEAMLAQLSQTAASASSSASTGPTFAVVGDSYTMYACSVPFVDTLIFQLARDENDAAVSDADNCSDNSSTDAAGTVAVEAERKLRRRCGEKRDFAWVALHSLLAAVEAGRTWLRDIDGQTITLLPRLGFALQASGPALLRSISDALIGGSGSGSGTATVASPTPSPSDVHTQPVAAAAAAIGVDKGRGMTVLQVPSRRAAGGCSLYLSVRRRQPTRRATGQQRHGHVGSGGTPAAVSRPPVDVGLAADDAAAVLQDTVELLPQFGGVRRAVLHRYAPPSPPAQAEAAWAVSGIRDPFVLVSFASPGAASEAQRWLNSGGGGGTGGTGSSAAASPLPIRFPAAPPVSSLSSGSAVSASSSPVRAGVTEAETGTETGTEIFAEFAFFEPKKRRRSTGGAAGGAGAAAAAGCDSAGAAAGSASSSSSSSAAAGGAGGAGGGATAVRKKGGGGGMGGGKPRARPKGRRSTAGGRKSLLGVRPSSNAAAAAGVARHAARAAAAAAAAAKSAAAAELVEA